MERQYWMCPRRVQQRPRTCMSTPLCMNETLTDTVPRAAAISRDEIATSRRLNRRLNEPSILLTRARALVVDASQVAFHLARQTNLEWSYRKRNTRHFPFVNVYTSKRSERFFRTRLRIQAMLSERTCLLGIFPKRVLRLDHRLRRRKKVFESFLSPRYNATGLFPGYDPLAFLRF